MASAHTWRIANRYIRDFGADAELEAAMFADSLLEAGDLVAHTAYCKVVKAIRELTRATPKEGEPAN